MADSRKNIKCDDDTFERLLALKDDTSFNWDEFLHALADAYEAAGSDESAANDGDGPTNEDIIAAIDELRATMPEETASTIEERLR